MRIDLSELDFNTLEDNIDDGGEISLLSTNWQTTAAVGLTVASGGVAGAIMLAAFPAQTIAATAGVGALAYAGKRRADGKSAFPFLDKKSKETESQEEAAPVAAAA